MEFANRFKDNECGYRIPPTVTRIRVRSLSSKKTFLELSVKKFHYVLSMLSSFSQTSHDFKYNIIIKKYDDGYKIIGQGRIVSNNNTEDVNVFTLKSTSEPVISISPLGDVMTIYMTILK